MILATCAALALALANPAGGGTYQLTQDCAPVAGKQPGPALTIRARYAAPVVIEAGRHDIAGMAVIGGGNVTLRGGRIMAPGGAQGIWPAGPAYYGLLLRGATGVVIEGTRFTNARKAVVVDESAGITIRFTRCEGGVEDCVIASRTAGLAYVHNIAGPFWTVPTICNIAGAVTKGLGKAACSSAGGTWTDGWHQDVLQLRDKVTDVLAAWNVINTTGQGITQMDTAGDLPLALVRVTGNDIRAGRHGLTLGRCAGCSIDRNWLASSVPGWKAVIIPGQALACGNTVPSGGAGREACK
ncbi:hypothetical protein [Sandarakinorhabdus sp.]|uniref:hypothetical protein n=1 Tax=Sandarakinorhabdus sp. TaxID=1916663 RepID=UPI00286E055F|nr:hypothetical protein [Sandarakinorhabdus sp.]